jgi:carbonic anhydrase/acetyltransferase-like protein (isoleucine patch superfamily)
VPLYPYFAARPRISPEAFVAPSADIVGDVQIGRKSGIWFGCVVRGDVARVRIGEETNVQDGTVVHVTRNGHPTVIGNGVTIGHRAVLHACRLEDMSFIGMGATVMDDAVVESGAMVAAGALVTPGKRVPHGQIWAGNPAKFFRLLTEEEATYIAVSRDNYVKHAEEYLGFLQTEGGREFSV